MTMKRWYQTKDEIPEALRGFYVEKDGKWMLDVDVSEDLQKLQGALENERNEHKGTKEKSKIFEGIDPELAKKLIEEHKKQQDKKLIDAGKVDELVQQRVEEVIKGHQKEMDVLKKQLEAATSQLTKELVDNKILMEARGAGVRDTAIDDVLLRGRQIFKLVDGKVVGEAEGKTLFGRDGKEMGIGDWIKSSLLEKAPHLFNNPSGAGAQPGAGQGGGTQQGVHKISRADARDPQKYSAVKAEAAKAGLTVEIVD